jgi:hypothetical protein
MKLSICLSESFSLPSAPYPVCVESDVGAANVFGHFLTAAALITALEHKTGDSMLAKLCSSSLCYVLLTDGWLGSQRLLSSVYNAYTSCQNA